MQQELFGLRGMLVIQTGSAEVTEDKVEQSVTTDCGLVPLWRLVSNLRLQ